MYSFVERPDGNTAFGRQQRGGDILAAQVGATGGRLVVIHRQNGNRRFPTGSDLRNLGRARHNHSCGIRQPVQYRRIGSGKLHFDRVFFEHDIITLHLDVRVGVTGRKILLNDIHVFHQRFGRFEIDDQFSVRERRRGDTAHQIIPCRRPAHGRNNVPDFGTSLKVRFDFPQVGGNPCGVRTFGQFVFDIELVVNHIGKESLPHVPESPDAQSEQNENDRQGRDTVPQTEAKQIAETTIQRAVIQFTASLGPRRLLQKPIRHQRHVHQSQDPTQQQTRRQHDKPIAHIDACRIGRKENGQKCEDGNDRSSEQRHGGFTTDGAHRFAARLAQLQIDQNTIYYDDRIVHQHPHCENERRQ